MSNTYDPAAAYLDVVRSRGIRIEVKDGATLWTVRKAEVRKTRDLWPGRRLDVL